MNTLASVALHNEFYLYITSSKHIMYVVAEITIYFQVRAVVACSKSGRVECKRATSFAVGRLRCYLCVST